MDDGSEIFSKIERMLVVGCMEKVLEKNGNRKWISLLSV